MGNTSDDFARLDERTKEMQRDYERLHSRVSGTPGNPGIEARLQSVEEALERVENQGKETLKILTGDNGEKSFAVILLKIENRFLEHEKWQAEHDKRETEHKQRVTIWDGRFWDFAFKIILMALSLLAGWYFSK